MPAAATTKSLESWIWKQTCSVRGGKHESKYSATSSPFIFTKRLYVVFGAELNNTAGAVCSRKKRFELGKGDHKFVRFDIPLVLETPKPPIWSVICKLSDKIIEAIGAANAKILSHAGKKRCPECLLSTLIHEQMTTTSRVHKPGTSA